MVEKMASTSFSEEGIFNNNGKRQKKQENPEGKKKVKTKSLYRQPSARELARLNEAELLFNSNLFRLQIEEVLNEVKIKEKTQKKFESWYEKFTQFLNDIPINDTEYDLSEGTLFKDIKIKPCVPKNFNATRCMFKFRKFENIRLVGAFGLGCSIDSNLIVDIDIEVPAETYTKNDSVNYKYHKKRGAYLSYIASHLKTYKGIEDLQFYWLNYDLHSPILEGKPSGKLGNYVYFRIHLSCNEDAYKMRRLAPSRNNLRETWLFNMESEPKDNELGPPTPHYNCTILRHLTAQPNQDFLERIFSNQENLKSAVVLLKVWLRQRQLMVSGYVIQMYVAYLVQLRRINNLMSSYQIIRNVWVALELSKWDTQGISLYQGIDSPAMTEFLKYFSIVFLDVTGYYNITYKMSKGTYQALKVEATQAVNMLDNGNLNSFIPLFMKMEEDLEQFDHIVRFKNTDVFLEKVYNSTPKEKQVSYGIDKVALSVATVYAALHEGLGDRVFLIADKVESDFCCCVTKKLDRTWRETGFQVRVSFGFLLNSDSAMNIVLKGPPSEGFEAEKFRAFWGDKAELRRFQDGTITEACVWQADSIAQKRIITKQIVQYIMERKFDLQADQLFYVADQLDSVLIRRQVLPTDGIIGTGEELSLKVIQAFDELRTDLRGLTDLPLDIISVNGTSAILSYTDPFPLIGQTKIVNPWQRGQASLIKEVKQGNTYIIPSYTPVYEAVIELTHSGKWPGHLEPFRCLKAAFYVKIAEQLTNQYSLLAHPYKQYLDVVKNGVVFRLRIGHHKELTLLRRYTENGVVRHRDTEESAVYYRDHFQMPRLRGALHGVQQRYPAFGPTACLLKRFLSAHMIDEFHFPELVAELLAAHVFVHPEPYAVPMQPLCAFARLLRLIADTDWATEMLLIDFNGDLKPEQKADLERTFSSIPPEERPPLYIVTSVDGSRAAPSSWSTSAPRARALARACALASRARDALSAHLGRSYTDNVLGAFVPQESGYDVTITLLPQFVPFANERVTTAPAPKPHPVETEPWTVVPVVDFQPVRTYLNDIRNAYGDFAVFFYDTYGGEFIGVLWKPQLDDVKQFEISKASGLMPLRDNDNRIVQQKYTINKEAIIEDFRILGDGIIKEVIVPQEEND